MIDQKRSKIHPMISKELRNPKVHNLRMERIYSTRALNIFTSSFGLIKRPRKCGEHRLFVTGSDSPILSIRGHGTKPLKDPHPRLHPPEDRMFIIKERCWGEGKEELRTYGSLDGTRWDDEDVRTISVGA